MHDILFFLLYHYHRNYINYYIHIYIIYIFAKFSVCSLMYIMYSVRPDGKKLGEIAKKIVCELFDMLYIVI